MSLPASPSPRADGAEGRRYCVVVLVKRAPGQEREVFRLEAARHFEEQAPVAGCALRAHSQTVEKAYRNGEPVYDAVEEYLFADHAAALAWAGIAGRMSVPARRDVLLTEVVIVVEGPVAAQGLKHIELLNRNQAMTRQAFMTYWRDTHGPLAAAIPGVRRYHQLPVTDLAHPACTAGFDGMAILWFDSVAAMREGAQHPAFRMTREDMLRLVNPDRSSSLLVQEVCSSGQR